MDREKQKNLRKEKQERWKAKEDSDLIRKLKVARWAFDPKNPEEKRTWAEVELEITESHIKTEEENEETG